MSKWETKLLGEVATSKSSKLTSKDTRVLKYVGLENIESERFRLNGYSYSDTTTSQNNIFNEGDILFGKLRPNLKKSIKACFNGCCSGEILVLRTVSPELAQSYLQYIFQDERIYGFCESLVAGTKMPRVSWTDLSEYEVRLPSLPEQKKIAEILTSVDRVIELTSMEIDKLKDLKKGVMQELLTKGIGHTKFKDSPVGKIPESWEILPLASLAQENFPITYGVLKPGDFVENGIPLIQIKDILNPELNISNIHRISESLDMEYSRTKLHGGEILISLIGTIGRVYKVETKLAGANIHRNLGRIKIKCSETRDYVFNYLGSEICQTKITLASQGSSQAALNLETLRDLELAIPTAKEEIVKINNSALAIDGSIGFKIKKLKGLELLKKGLMNDLLTGKVRVKV